MKKIVISVPVHEQPAVVENQVKNIQKFVPNSIVVLHASGDSSNDFANSINQLAKKFDGFVYVNPTRLNTYSPNDAGNVRWLTSVHKSQFDYISSITNFDVFAIDTSNDMFVRTGIEDLFENYDCGFLASRTPVKDFPWQNIAEELKPYIDVKCMEKGSQEGSWYSKDAFQALSDVVGKMGGMKSMEEVYLPSIIFNVFPELYEKNCNTHYVSHNAEHYAISRNDIHAVMYGERKNQYAVKRVPRVMSDPTRIYVNQITGLL